MCVPTPCSAIVARILLFVLIFNISLFSKGLALQQYGKQKVTIVANNITLENVFKQIEKQTGMRFMYATGALNTNEKVKVSFQQTALDDVLTNLLGAKGMVWQYREGVILLKQQVNEKSDSKISEDLQSHVGGNVTGKITDGSGIPIPGATVQIKGTKRGTKTMADGSFSLQNVESGDVLLITSIGFETKEVPVNNESYLLLKMKAVIGVLDEAVVIAYGKASGRTLVGNVSIVKGEDIARSPVSNPLLALSGRVAGLAIDQKTGFSGSGVVTLVQGQNSIIKGNDPFYVIDGVPYPSQNLTISGELLGVSGVNTYNRGSTLNFINPADIESITVLKDADATAIYGSRAANGAILITTKKGKQGKNNVSFDYQQGFGKVTRKLDLMNTKEYLQMRHEAILNDGGTVQPTDYDINGVWDTTRYTNWQKEYIGKTAQYMNLNGSLSGGTSNLQYLIGGTFHRETTVMPGDFNDQKGGIHFNINSNSENNKFQAQLSGSYLVDNNKLSNYDLTQLAMTTPPDAPKSYNPDGSINFMVNDAGSSTFLNPLANLDQKYNLKTNNLVSNLVLSYAILPGLNIRSSFGYTNMQTNELVILPLSAYPPEYRPYYERTGLYGNYNINTWIAEPQITYNRALGNGKLDFLVGASIQHNNSKGNQIAGTGFNSDEAISDMNSAITLTSNAVVNNVYKYAGVFGRINYTYDEKYIINISARRDGTSRFGAKNMFHNFGAVGVGWTFSKEKFISDNLSFLSYGKLRVSYGTTGNDQIGDYMFYNLYNPLVTGVPYRGINSLISRGIANPYLQWEETKKINFGLDLGIIKDKVVLNANYYINRSSNQLLIYQVPIITGVNGVLTNYPATVQNTGWEFTLNGNIIQKSKFHWSANVNLTIPRNKLIEFKNLETSSYASVLVVGKPITITKLFHYAGVDPETGRYQFTDSKGAVTTSPDYSTDRIVLGNSSPKWYAGLSSSLSYGGVSLDFLFQFMKRDGFNYFTGANFPGYYGLNQPTYLLDRWRKVNDVAAHQRYSADYSIADGYNNASLSDASFRDASYCRLKNVSLSWQLPGQWVKHAYISSARVYAQGQNLLTITSYKGLDPETLSSNSLPPLKTFVFGLQIGF